MSKRRRSRRESRRRKKWQRSNRKSERKGTIRRKLGKKNRMRRWKEKEEEPGNEEVSLTQRQHWSGGMKEKLRGKWHTGCDQQRTNERRKRTKTEKLDPFDELPRQTKAKRIRTESDQCTAISRRRLRLRRRREV